MASRMMFTLLSLYTGCVSGMVSRSLMNNESDSNIIQIGTRTATPSLPVSENNFVTSKNSMSSREPELYSENISATSSVFLQTIYSDNISPGTNSVLREENQTQTLSLETSKVTINNSTVSEYSMSDVMVIDENRTAIDQPLVSSMTDIDKNTYLSFTSTISIYNSAIGLMNSTALSDSTVTSRMTPALSTAFNSSLESVFHTSIFSDSHMRHNLSMHFVYDMESQSWKDSESKSQDMSKSVTETWQKVEPTSTVLAYFSLTMENQTIERNRSGYRTHISSNIFSSLPNSVLESKVSAGNRSREPESDMTENESTMTSVDESKFPTNIPFQSSSYSFPNLQMTYSSHHLTTTAINDNVSTITVRSPTKHIKKMYKFSYEIEFTGECRSLESREAIAEMWGGIENIVGREAGIKDIIAIQPLNILCQPLRLSFNVVNTTHKNLTERLKVIVDNNTFTITIIVGQYKTVFIAKRIYAYSENDMNSDIFLLGLNEVDIIIIICATSISVILVCAGILICAREYYLKKRTRSFTLSSFMSKSSKSYDYSLTKMPRPNSTYSENGVRLKSIDSGDGQQTSLLPPEEQETTISDIKLKVNSNDNGIIVGVTGIEYSRTKHQTSDGITDEHGDQSEEMLCPKSEETAQSVDNPIYFADDERFPDV